MSDMLRILTFTIRIKLYEQESDMVRKRGKPNSGDTTGSAAGRGPNSRKTEGMSFIS